MRKVTVATIAGMVAVDRLAKTVCYYGMAPNTGLPKDGLVVGPFLIGIGHVINPGTWFGATIPYMAILMTAGLVAMLFLANDATMMGNSVGYLVIMGAVVTKIADHILYNGVMDYFLMTWVALDLADVMLISGFALWVMGFNHHNERSVQNARP